MGYSQAITPNMDRLAEKGVTFQNGHTAGIFCAPSRSAIFTGRYASTTGAYRTQVYYFDNPHIKPLQQRFQDSGYLTYGGGKLFHHPAGYVDHRGWDEFYTHDETLKKEGWPVGSWKVPSDIIPKPYPNSIFNHDRSPANKFFLEWGKVLNEDEEKMADTKQTNWACDIIRRQHEKPFFLAVGLYTPHFPNYAPAKYFDLYKRDEIEIPPYLANDLDDLPEKVRQAKVGRSAIHKRLEKLNAVKDAIHGYLACTSYADAMLGRVLDAMESGPNADNTILFLWSDHGYHHGEKMDWGKHTLWERTTNVPFMWAGPSLAKGASIDASVSLIDILPTLTELCQLPKDDGLEGTSLASFLKNPDTAKDRDIYLPGMQPEEYTIMNQEWRYIRYADGAEELYQVQEDPNEWTNLADKPEYAETKAHLAAKAPKTFAKPGLTHHQLKLVIEGETYRWEIDKTPKKKKKPKKK